MKSFDTAAYFSQRARRYEAAIQGCPDARILDYLPYVAALLECNMGNDSELRICDAFGGNGFLPRGFTKKNMSFVVSDCCPAMLKGTRSLENVEQHITNDDFESVLATYGEGFFDAVFCHGGIHHVVEIENGSVDVYNSRLRQSRIASRLFQLVRPGGVLVFGDIPQETENEIRGPLDAVCFNASVLEAFLHRTRVFDLCSQFDLSADSGMTLRDLRQQIESRLWLTVDWPVPRRFFDEFVTSQTGMGHTAAYLRFDELDQVIVNGGAKCLGRINYKGPWLFQTRSEAGWFFREKFSIDSASKLGDDLKTELDVYETLKKYLGTRETEACVAVNWGVTYAAYQKGSGRDG